MTTCIWGIQERLIEIEVWAVEVARYTMLMREAQLGAHLQPCEMKRIEVFLAPVYRLICGYYKAGTWYHRSIHSSIHLSDAICPRVRLLVSVPPSLPLCLGVLTWSFSMDCLRSEADRSPAPETHRSRLGWLDFLHHADIWQLLFQCLLAWRFDGSWFSPRSLQIPSCMFRALG